MREEDVPQRLIDLDCPDLGAPPWREPPAAAQRRVSLISTAGLMQRGDTPFGLGAADYRVVDAQDSPELLMTHISTNFDRSGFFQDHEVVFPLARLRELAEEGMVAAPARYHYSFMGATSPEAMEPAARQLARVMHQEGVDTALLLPV